MSFNTTIAAGSIPLLERETELGALQSALARAAAGAGGVVLIDGVPGVGKSRLLASARSQARDLGLRVLEARGAAIERRFAFGVVRQLFEPVVLALNAEDRAPLFSGAAALAGSVLSETAAAPPAAGDAEFGILNGLYWLTVNLSDGGPLLLAVDDAHWADAPSLRFLGYLSRRLEGLPVLVAATGRSADSEGDELWSALAGDPLAEVLRPNPLSDSASAELVRSRLRADADPHFCAACHRATAGNPLFLGELLAALSSAGVEPSADAAAAVTDLGPGAVARFVLHRLERLGPAATALAQALAVFGDEVDVPLAAQAAGLELDAARAAADLMVQADVLAPDQLLRFVHPVVQTAVYENLLPGDRAARHGAVARLLEQAQARPEQIAAHVLRARPEGDAGWVDDLRAAAAKASERGDPLGATTWLRRALEEPPGDDAAAEILCELGNLEVGIREHAQARDHLLAVLESSPRRDLRTRAGVWLARSALIWGKAQAASDALEVLLSELERTQREDRLELEAEILILTRIELSLRHLVPEWLERFATDAAGNDGFEAIARIHQASEAIVGGGAAAPAADVLEASLPAVPANNPFAFGIALEGLILTERYTTAARWTELALDAARATGFGTRIANLHSQRAWLAFVRGAVGEAQLDAQTALELAGTDYFYARRVVAVAIQTAIERDELDAAQELADASTGELDRERILVDEYLTSRGNLRIARGDLRGGLADLLRAGELQASYGLTRPADWRSEAARVLALLGERERAEQISAEAVECARRFGARRPLTRALRYAGRLKGGEEGLALLEEAVAVGKGSEARLELAYAYADLGSELVQRRRRREGRDVLRLALEEALACGATALSQRIRGDFAAGAGRPPRTRLTGLDALTPAERRTCDLAVRDLSNREIAQKLFVTEKTVELHLTNAYRKLGIRSRFQLATVIPDSAGPGVSAAG